MINCLKRKKIRHGSEHKARIHAQTVYRTKGIVLDVYFCYHCGCWHIGHAMNKMKQRELEKHYDK